jgi:hypothetical protein
LPLLGLAGNNPASCRKKNTPTPGVTRLFLKDTFFFDLFLNIFLKNSDKAYLTRLYKFNVPLLMVVTKGGFTYLNPVVFSKSFAPLGGSLSVKCLTPFSSVHEYTVLPGSSAALFVLVFHYDLSKSVCPVRNASMYSFPVSFNFPNLPFFLAIMIS